MAECVFARALHTHIDMPSATCDGQPYITVTPHHSPHCPDAQCVAHIHRAKLFERINSHPTLFEVVAGQAKGISKPAVQQVTAGSKRKEGVMVSTAVCWGASDRGLNALGFYW
jgi:hypothetical protein